MLGYVSRGIAYSSFLSAAVLSLTSPTPSLLVAIGSKSALILPPLAAAVLPVAWGLLFFLASLACLLGVITRTWVGEYIGISALFICCISLGIAQILAGLLISGLVIGLGLGGLIAYRWYLVIGERRNAIKRFQSLQSWYNRPGQG